MADEVLMGGKSKEEVAFELLRVIAHQEGKPLHVKSEGADRNYILTGYLQCWDAVHGSKPRQ